MRFEFPWTRQRREDQALHLEALRAVQIANSTALKVLVEAAQAASERLVRDREAYLASLQIIRDVALGSSNAVSTLSESVTAYLKLYQHDGKVEGHVHTDYTEWKMEKEAQAAEAAALGFPVDLGPEAQLAWVMKATEQE